MDVSKDLTRAVENFERELYEIWEGAIFEEIAERENEDEELEGLYNFFRSYSEEGKSHLFHGYFDHMALLMSPKGADFMEKCIKEEVDNIIDEFKGL